MGITIGMSRSSYDAPCQITPPNPDPFRYKVLQYKQVRQFLLVIVEYEGCTTFEGKKILVYKDVDIKKLSKQESLDPHFSDNTAFYSPIARFIPTVEGWQMAIEFTTNYQLKAEI